MMHNRSRFTYLFSIMILFVISVGIANAQGKKYEALLGIWDAVVQTDGGDYYFTFTFAAEEDSLTGTFASEMGDASLENVKYKDNNVTCDFVIQMPDAEMYLDVDCKIEEGKMTGIMGSDMGEFPMSATKLKKEEE